MLAAVADQRTSRSRWRMLVSRTDMHTPPSPPAEGGSADRSLLQRLHKGSEDAATQLYLRYVNRLRALTRSQCSAELARLVDTEDIVQSIFGSFFRGASQGYYEVPAGEELWKLF